MEAEHKNYDEGDRCKHVDCIGKYEFQYPPEGCCSCHINPPCGYCTSSKLACDVCGDEPYDS